MGDLMIPVWLNADLHPPYLKNQLQTPFGLLTIVEIYKYIFYNKCKHVDQ